MHFESACQLGDSEVQRQHPVTHGTTPLPIGRTWFFQCWFTPLGEISKTAETGQLAQFSMAFNCVERVMEYVCHPDSYLGVTCALSKLKNQHYDSMASFGNAKATRLPSEVGGKGFQRG